MAAYINSRITLSDESISIRNVAGVCLQSCKYLMRHITKEFVGQNDKLENICLFLAEMCSDFECITRAVSLPGSLTEFSSIKVMGMTSQSYPLNYEHGQPIFCESSSCLKLCNAMCSCFVIKLVRIITKCCYEYLIVSMTHAYERQSLSLKLHRALRQLLEISSELNNCSDDSNHKYDIKAINVKFMVPDQGVQSLDLTV